MQAQTALDFPRTYRASAANCATMYVLGGICAGAGALGTWYFSTGQDPKTQGSAAIVLATLATLLFALGAYLIYSIAHFRVVLNADAIDVQLLANNRTYARAEFSAWRISHPSKGPNMVVLAFRDGTRRPLKIPQYFKLDDAFLEWLGRLDNLDRLERQAAEREIAENTELGSTAEERLAKLPAARRISIGLTIATICACVWVMFFPKPYRVAVAALALIPWVALCIAARSHGLFRVDQKRNDPHPNVAIAFMMPGFILAVRAIADVHLIGWETPLLLTIAISAGLTFAAYKADPSLRTNRPMLALLLMLGLAYGFGATTLSNALLDRSHASVYSTRVLDKYISHGRSTTYRLKLDAWGPRPTAEWVDVSLSFYTASARGSEVCVYLHHGAWRVPWYIVRHCAP